MTSPTDQPTRTPARHRWPKRLAIALGCLALVCLVAGFFLGRYLRAAVDAGELEVLLNEALVAATDGLYEATISGIEWRAGGLSLEISGLSVMLVPETLAAMDAAGTTPEILFQIQHTTVSVTGIDLWSLLRRRGFRALSLTVREPLVQVSGLEELLGAEAPTEGEVTDKRRQRPTGKPKSVPSEDPTTRAMPEVEIWQLALENATLESYRRQQAETTRETFTLFERFESVTIEIDGVDLAHPDETRLLFADDLTVEIVGYYYVWPNGLHEERLGRVSLSTAGGYIRIKDLSLTPRFDRQDEVAEDGSAPMARRTRIHELRVEGVDFARLIDDLEFTASDLILEGAEIDLTSDPPTLAPALPTGDLAKPVTEVRPGALMTGLLQGLPRISIDRVLVDGFDFHAWVDRDDEAWLPTPRLRGGVEGAHLELRDYVSGPDVEFDPARPFFAANAEVSASRIVTSTKNGLHQFEIADWSMSEDDQYLTASSVSLVPLFDRRSAQTPSGAVPTRFELTTGDIRLSGLDFGSLIEDIDVEIGTVRIEEPQASQTISLGKRRNEPKVRRGSVEELVTQLLPGVPDVQIGSVEVTGGRYELLVDRTSDGWLPEEEQHLLADQIEIRLNSVVHHERGGYDPTQPLFAQASEARIGLLGLRAADGFERLVLDGVRVATSPASLSIEGAELAPVDDDPAALGRRIRSTGIVPRFTAGRFELAGPVLRRYIEDGRIAIDRLEIQEPRVQLLTVEKLGNADHPEPIEPGAHQATLQEMLEGLPSLQIAEISVSGAGFERYVAPLDHDWSELPPPLEAVRSLDLRLSNFDTSPEVDQRRLLLSDRFELEVHDMSLNLGKSGDTLQLSGLSLSSERDSLLLRDALLSFGGAKGTNRFAIGGTELNNIPYRRLFRSLLEPPTSGTPVVAAMVDRDMTLSVDGVRGDLAGGKRLVEIGPVIGSAADGSLRIESVSLRPTQPDADPSTRETEFPQDELLVQAGPVKITGVDFDRLAESGALRAAALELVSPKVDVVRGLDQMEAAPQPAPERNREPVDIAAAIESAVADLPVVRVDSVRIDDIGFHERPSLEGSAQRGFDDIDLAIDGLDLRPDRDPAAPEGPFYADDIRLSIPRQHTPLNKGYTLEVGPVEISTGANRVDLGTVRYHPIDTVDDYLARPMVMERARVEVSVEDVVVEEIDLASLLRDRSLSVGLVLATEPSVWVLSDGKKTKPKGKQKFSPHRAVQRSPILFSIDRTRVLNGDFRFSRRHPRGEQPGHIWWDQVYGEITNVSNDPEHMSFETPLVMSLSARMLDQSPIILDWRVPLLEPPKTMSYSARLSNLPATSLSSILVPTEGVRVKGGQLDQVWLDIDVREGRATGTVNGLYSGLGVQLENRTTGRRGFANRAVSVAANLILPSHNYEKDGKPRRVGKVDFEPAPEIGFFKVFWDGIKVGVIDLMI